MTLSYQIMKDGKTFAAPYATFDAANRKMVFDTGMISDLVSANSDSNIDGCHTLTV